MRLLITGRRDIEVQVLSPSRIVRPGDDEIAAWLALVAGRLAA